MVGMFAVASAALLPQAHPVEGGRGKEALKPAEVHAPVAPGRCRGAERDRSSGLPTPRHGGAERRYRDRSLMVTGIVRSAEGNLQGEMVETRPGPATRSRRSTRRWLRGMIRRSATLVKGQAASLLYRGEVR